MIGMLMRDENRIQVSRIFANRGKTLKQLFAAEAGVDQNTRARRCDECRVA